MRRTRPHKFNIFYAIATLVFFLLSACGGGGGSVAGGGIGGTGVVSVGAVTDLGSVYVNGSVYNTDSAAFTLDDSPGAEADIRRGMVVRIDGTRDTVTTGTANTVVYEDVVEGPLTIASAQPADIVTLTVLGQTVIVEEGVTYVDDGTVPAPNPLLQNLPDFSTVTALEVSGLRDASAVNGVIRATYIKIKTGLTEYEVKGVVENANPPGSPTSFEIAGLTITTDGSTVGTIPTDGTPVEVKGLAGDFSTGPDTLVADSIETRAADLGETEFDHAEVEGFIKNLDTLNETFSLNGQVINYAGAAFEGSVVGDLDDGTKVEAEGSISSGILIADKIEFKEVIRIEGDASSDDSGGSFKIDGISELTIFVDPAVTQYKDFTIPAVNIGDHIRIRGRKLSGPGEVLATEIRLRSSDTKVELQAPVTNFTLPPTDSVSLLDMATPISTTGLNFWDIDDVTSLSDSEFYGSLETGDLVKLSGNLSGVTVIWEDIERED